MAYPIHEYLITTAEITTQCFFFAGTLNAAVGAWIFQMRYELRKEKEPHENDIAKIHDVSRIMIRANFVLALIYFPILPFIYWVSFNLVDAADKSFGFKATLCIWAIVAIGFGYALFKISAFWRSDDNEYIQRINKAKKLLVAG